MPWSVAFWFSDSLIRWFLDSKISFQLSADVQLGWAWRLFSCQCSCTLHCSQIQHFLAFSILPIPHKFSTHNHQELMNLGRVLWSYSSWIFKKHLRIHPIYKISEGSNSWTFLTSFSNTLDPVYSIAPNIPVPLILIRAKSSAVINIEGSLEAGVASLHLLSEELVHQHWLSKLQARNWARALPVECSRLPCYVFCICMLT